MSVERRGWGYSIAANIALAALHTLIAAVSGSLAVARWMWSSLVCLLTAVAVLAGLRVEIQVKYA